MCWLAEWLVAWEREIREMCFFFLKKKKSEARFTIGICNVCVLSVQCLHMPCARTRHSFEAGPDSVEVSSQLL